jgi:hypothetical protein
MRTLVLAVGLLAVWTSSAAAAPESPRTDAFYRAPAGYEQAAPGQVFASRPVEVRLGGAPTSSSVDAYQLLYRTNDAHGRPVANVTTVLVPKGPRPEGGRNLISLQDAEDSLDPDCAPSYQLQQDQRDSPNLFIESSIGATELGKGGTVVIPDHEGPQSQYIVTGMEGHAVLDSIRAVESFEPAQLDGARTQVGMVGYSGGAHATAAANELQPAYAPELHLVAVAAGGVPVGNRDTVEYLDGSVGAGVLIAVSVALDRAFPSFRLQDLLNEKGKAFAKQVETGCASSVFAAPYSHLDDYTKKPHAIDLPRVKRIIRRNKLGHHTPTAPSFYYNGVRDELIWIKPLDELVAKYCSSGARIQYVRDEAGLEHIQGVANFAPQAVAYLDDRFAGAPVPSTCPPVPATPEGTEPCGARATIRLRVPKSLRVRRIRVRVAGRLVRTLRHRAESVVLRRRAKKVRVTIEITGRRHGHFVLLVRKAWLRPC